MNLNSFIYAQSKLGLDSSSSKVQPTAPPRIHAPSSKNKRMDMSYISAQRKEKKETRSSRGIDGT